MSSHLSRVRLSSLQSWTVYMHLDLSRVSVSRIICRGQYICLHTCHVRQVFIFSILNGYRCIQIYHLCRVFIISVSDIIHIFIFVTFMLPIIFIGDTLDVFTFVTRGRFS
jgi:hypothetical protein